MSKLKQETYVNGDRNVVYKAGRDLKVEIKNASDRKKGRQSIRLSGKIFQWYLILIVLTTLSVVGYFIINKIVSGWGKLYVTNLSFMDGFTHSPMTDRELRDSIDHAVMKGMYRAHLPSINHFSFKRSKTYKYREKLINITFDPDLTKGEKIEKIIEEVMTPMNIDAVVSLFYIYHEPFITLRPLIVIKNIKKIATKNLQFLESELFCKDLIKKEKILCDTAESLISRAVKELVRYFKLENMYIRSFPFMYVKSTSFWRKETYLWEKSIHTFMKNREEEELINRAVLQGIYETQRIINPNEKLMINAPGHVIRNSEDNVNDLVNILSDPNLTKNDMIDKIIQEIMEPHQVDILVTGFFIHKPEEQLVTFCPMVIIRPYRDMIFRTIQIKKEDLKGTGIPGKNKIISEITYGLIVWTVQEMLGQVSDPSKWK